MALNDDQAARLQSLLRYLDRWKAAQQSYYSWIYFEWRRRVARFGGIRDRARGLLLKSAMNSLALDQAGRVRTGSRAAFQAKRKFRARTDAILSAVVESGEENFGIKGE